MGFGGGGNTTFMPNGGYIKWAVVDVQCQASVPVICSPFRGKLTSSTFVHPLALLEMDSFFPIANPIPAEETQVPTDFEGSSQPGSSGKNCTIC
ncbi:hypothetical protein NLI96_g1152 [Meripilus lineatus]|uniref:Uncharacterized protein n=1 Tax=Meripilus lineatus TaxID=2056292 RepID=A0AAD5VAR3_9APHY|nr:hypothetical protein NLI96_g1152 [Physisporinus lineatus]